MPIFFVLSLSLLNSISAAAARVVLALYALELGAQPLTVGILAATFAALPLVLSVPAGRLSDSFGARWLLVAGALVGGLGMLTPFLAHNLPAIFIAAAVIGSSAAIYNVLTQNLVGLLSSPHDRPKNFSNYSLVGSLANLIGPLVAGFSIDLSDHAAACLYLALLTFVPLPMLAIYRGPLRGSVRKEVRPGGGVRAMLAEPGVRRLLATTSLLNTGQELYRFYMPIYTHAIGLSASTIGIVLAMNSLAMFAVRTVLPRLIARFKEQRVLAYAFYVSAASLTLIPLFEGAVILASISFILGLGMGCGQPIITMLMFSGSAEGRSGEALGLRMSVIYLTKMVGPVVFGSIGSAFGVFPVFWINALMLGTGGMLSRPQEPAE
jgi:MFS family permease